MPLIPASTLRRCQLALGILVSLLACQFMTPAALAAGCHTPAAGSPERKAIMDSLRNPVMGALKQRVVFVVAKLKVCGNWAFLEAEPRRPGGKPVDWTIGDYADAVADDMCGGYVHALLIRRGGRWKVREHVICATDVPYVTWPEEFGAPAALFSNVASPATDAKCPYAPAVGSAERQAIMGAVRAPVEKDLNQDVKFLVKKFAVCGNWAFLEALPQKPNGKPVNWALSSYAEDAAAGMCGFHVDALLIKKGARWMVRYYEICATDVPYVTWPKDYGAPAALFPHVEW